MNKFFTLILLCFLSVSAAEKPNIILVLVDDMGFSDLGSYGGEIETPVLDKMAKEGLRFKQFYTTGRCCPSRASLLTGLYQHQAGVGHMQKDEGLPGYRGRLVSRAVTLGEVLNTAGYHTFTTGKWHVGNDRPYWPIDRGFDRSYVCPEGAGFYFNPNVNKVERRIVEDDKVIFDKTKNPPKDWYSTDVWVDKGLEYIAEAQAKKEPFFWYLAHNAPHFPLKAKPEDIAKYRGRYKEGWDKLRETRYQNLIKLGIIDESWPLSARSKRVKAWDKLSEKDKDEQDLRMAIYAACLDSVDQNMQRILTQLKKMNALDNTLIVFMSDNGACNEGGIMGSNKLKGKKGEPGSLASNVFYGESWANLSSVPFRLFKKNGHEGGIASPLIAYWPKGIKRSLNGSFVEEPTHLIDMMATFVDIAGAEYPAEFNGHKILPMEGVSVAPSFTGKEIERAKPLFFEHEGHKAIRLGKWKLVAVRGKAWELYDMEKDRTELNNLAKTHPEMVDSLKKKWETWAKNSFVIRDKSQKKKKSKK